jgi:hypothetical protein
VAYGDLLIGTTSSAPARLRQIPNTGSTVEDMGQINVALSEELETALRFTTIERFSGRKGDLTRAVEDAVQTWVANEEARASTRS